MYLKIHLARNEFVCAEISTPFEAEQLFHRIDLFPDFTAEISYC